MRKKPHLAVITTPISSLVNPVLPIVSTLLRRGHRVSCVTSDPFALRFQALGAEVIKHNFGRITAQGLDKQSYCRLALHGLAAGTSFYEKNRPDLIVYDLVSFAGPIWAHKWQVPLVRISPFYVFSPQTLERQMDSARATMVLQWNIQIDEFLNQHGVPSRNFLFHREKLNIHMMPRDFDPCAANDECCLYAGRCAGEQIPFGDSVKSDNDNRPVILVATSRSHVRGCDYFRTCIKAFSNLNCRVLLSVDESTDVSGLYPLPPNIEIITHTSHTRILPHADLLVFMGGLTAANEAAYHGVPFVITSLAVPELQWLGDNLARLNVGPHIRGADLNPSELRTAAVETLESTEIRANVMRLQRRVRREPGAEDTANRLEDCLHS